MAISTCKICFKNFYVKPSHLKRGWGKFCSKKCQFQGQMKGKIVSCALCFKNIYKSPKNLRGSKSGKYFCNRSCQTKWRNNIFSGDKSANWLDGKSVYRSILLKTGTKPSCFLCELSDIRILNAHHKDHDRSNNKLQNLIWLCLNCHYLVHHSSEFDQKVRKYA